MKLAVCGLRSADPYSSKVQQQSRRSSVSDRRRRPGHLRQRPPMTPLPIVRIEGQFSGARRVRPKAWSWPLDSSALSGSSHSKLSVGTTLRGMNREEAFRLLCDYWSQASGAQKLPRFAGQRGPAPLSVNLG